MGLYTVMNLALAILAMVASVWVWMLQQRRERPNLRAYANRLTVLDMGDRTAQPFTVANLSALPDVLFKVRVSALSKDGRWLPLHDAPMYEMYPSELPPNVTVHTKLPINLTPHQTVTFYLKVQHVDVELADPFQYRVELIGLGGRTHTCQVVKRPPQS